MGGPWWAGRLQNLEQVHRRVRDAQKLGGGFLQHAGRLVGGKVNGGALEPFALEFVPKLKF